MNYEKIVCVPLEATSSFAENEMHLRKCENKCGLLKCVRMYNAVIFFPVSVEIKKTSTGVSLKMPSEN